MKKISFLLTVIIVFLFVFSVGSFASTKYTYGYLNYVIEDDEVKIVEYFGSKRDVTVPNMIAGYPVAVIGEGAFYDTAAVNVFLPDTIMRTEVGAFSEGVSVVYKNADGYYETNHTWDAGVVISNPTCASTGKITYTCSMCNTKRDVTIAKLTTHTYDSVCDSECNVCGFVRSVTHTPGSQIYYDESGHYYFCTVCGEKANYEVHKKGSEATSTAPCKCSVCGYIITPATNHTHSIQFISAIDATCTLAGNIDYYKCSGCGKAFSDEAGTDEISLSDVIIPPTGHTIVIDDSVPSTGETYGKTAGSHCSVCGTVLIAQKPILPISKAIEKAPNTVLTGSHSVVTSEDGNQIVSYSNNDEQIDYTNDVIVIEDSDFGDSEDITAESNYEDTTQIGNQDTKISRSVIIIIALCGVGILIAVAVVIYNYQRKKKADN